MRKLTRPFGALVLGLLLVGTITGPAGADTRDRYRAQRTHIENRARDQIGTRYRYGGTSPSRGFDCSGFTRWLYSKHGASLPHSSLDQFNLGRRDRYKRIWKRSKLEVGDLVFHKTTSARVGHVGVYIGGQRFISSTSSGGVRIRSIYDPYYWGPRWVGATRLPVTMRYKP